MTTDDSAKDTRRRFEQWARNPSCAANTVSAILNVRMADVAKAEGGTIPFGQSPFALARGQAFERRIFKNDAEILRAELEAQAVLAPKSRGFADFRFRQSGGPFQRIDDARKATDDWLHEVAAGKHEGCIAAGACIRIPGGGMLPHADLCIDALAVRHEQGHPGLVIGEIKVYPDRGGHTDPVQLATSRAQAGLYVHGLRVTLAQQNLAGRVAVLDSGFLALSRSGSNRLSVRCDEDFGGQAMRAKVGLQALAALSKKLSVSSENLISEVQSAAVDYCEACVSFCERADRCRDEAAHQGKASILGDDVRRFLDGISLGRVGELMAGSEPLNDHEREVVRQLRMAGHSDGQ